MSTQPTPIIIGPRFGQAAEFSGVSDLQRLIDRVRAILSRRRWLFVIPMLTGILVTLTISLFLPRLYVLTAMFERRDDPVLVELIQSNSPYSFASMRRSLVIDLLNRDAIQTIAAEIAAGNGAGTPDGAKAAVLDTNVRSMLPRIKVNVAEKGSELDLVEITYTGDNPELAAQVVNRLKDRYITEVQQRIHDILERSHAFFSAEAQRRRGELVALQSELMKTASENPGVSPSNPDLLDQLHLNASRAVDDLVRRRGELETQLTAFEKYLAELESSGSGGIAPSLPSDPAAGWMNNPRRGELAALIQQLESQIADAVDLKGMTIQHPHVERLQSKLDRVRLEYLELPERIARKAPQLSASPIDPLAAERRRIELESTALREQMAGLDQELETRRAELARYTQDRSTIEERRKAFALRRHELNRVESDFEAWNSHIGMLERALTAKSNDRGIHFRTISAATAPARPFSPTIGGLFLLSAGIGIAIGTAVVFLREVFDRSFRDLARVRQSLGIPVLELIGEIRAGAPAGWRMGRIVLPAVASLQAALLIAVSALVYLNLDRPDVYDRLVSRTAAVVRGA